MVARVIVFAEAEADRGIVCDLIDRKIRDYAPEWLDRKHLDDYREWCGTVPGEKFTPWKLLKHLDKQTLHGVPGSRQIGFPSTGPLGFDGAATRKALQHCHLLPDRPAAVVLVRDMDNQAAERRASIQTQRDLASGSGKVPAILALPNAKREAWVLNGFVERNQAEKAKLAELRKELGFHPCDAAEKLTATSEHKKDVKRIARVLLANDREREESCWRETEWEVLRQRGVHTGLSDFLDEVRSRLLPVIYGRAPTGRSRSPRK